jgi:integrase
VPGRIEKVLDAAKAKGFREGENPARWRGHLDHLLPRPSKLARGHHAAMPYEDVAAFIAKLRKREATSALALELCILTAGGPVKFWVCGGPKWTCTRKSWTVPANRMKAGREHRVPVSPRAVAILRQLKELKTGEFVFPGQTHNKPLSNMAMEMVLRRMKVEDATVHGFRSSFRDWAGRRHLDDIQSPRQLARPGRARGDLCEEPAAQLAGNLPNGHCGRSTAADEAK